MSERDDQDQKPAEGAAPAAGDAPVPGKALLPKAQMTLGNHLLVWGLVLLVGVVFGMAPTFQLLQDWRRQPVIDEVPENDILRLRAVAEKLQQILAPYGQPQFASRDERGYAQQIRQAELAAQEGLRPSGKDLDAAMERFLERKTLGGDRTYRQALAEYQDNPRLRVDPQELRHFLSIDLAVDALHARHVALPAVPPAAAAPMVASARDRVELDQVVLSAKPLLAEVKPDDPELQVQYTELRGQHRFDTPPVATVTVATPDLAALAAKATVTPEAIKAYYDAHKESFRKPEPAKADAKPGEAKPADSKPAEAKPAEPQYLTLEEATPRITETLRQEQARAAARSVLATFADETVGEQKLDEKDAAAFAEAAADAGLTVTTGVTVVKPTADTLTVPGFGALKQGENVVRLFVAGTQPGTVSSALQTQAGGDEERWLVLRLERRDQGGTKELKDPEVLKTVTERVAGMRAWAELRKQADAIAAELAAKKEKGALRAWAGSDAAKKWDAKPETITLQPLSTLRPPAEQAYTPSSADERLAVSLALPESPVLVAESSGDTFDGVPTLRLVQAAGYRLGEPIDDPERLADAYRRGLSQYEYSLFSEELRKKLK